jgi:hypothetical protein
MPQRRFTRRSKSLIVLLLASSAATIAFGEDYLDPHCCEYPATSTAISAQSFLESCAVTGQTARGEPEYFDCQSYVLGTIGTMRVMQRRLPLGRRTCVPDRITTHDVLRLVWARYPNWSVPRARSGVELIIEVLESAYPCKAQQ